MRFGEGARYDGDGAAGWGVGDDGGVLGKRARFVDIFDDVAIKILEINPTHMSVSLTEASMATHLMLSPLDPT